MAASIIGYSNDLLSLILIHLPVKTLLRFKLVSKQWKFLISDDPHFALNHCRKNSDDLSTAPSGVFLYHPSRRRTDILSVPFLRGNPVPPLSLTFLDQLLPSDNYPRVFQSCNGLLLCVFFNNYVYRVNAKSLCVICNPTTRGFRVVSTPQDLDLDLGRKKCSWLDGLTLVFNPSESHHYKVVSIKRSSKIMQPRELYIYIYSSETNRWKFHLSSFNPPLEPNLLLQRGVFFSGAVFWIGWKRTYYYNVKSQNVGVIEQLHVPVGIRNDNMYSSYFAAAGSRTRSLFYALATSFCPPIYFIYEFDCVAMKWSDCRVEFLDWLSHQSGDCTTPHRTSVVAVVSKKADDNWDLMLSLTMPFTNILIIANSATAHTSVQKYNHVNNIYRFQPCEYVPSLVPI